MAWTQEVPRFGNIKAIKVLIWIYFFLLLFEGALRMLIPAAANALLVVRDPFLLLAYAIAQLSRIFPWNRFVVMLWLLGLIAMILSYFQLHAMFVILFGFRVAFLHVPLMFLIPRVMGEKDVLAIGRWFLIIAIPMAILMAVQFHVGPDSWLNRGLDNQFKQIDAADGKIRPPGTFSYITGPALFFAYVTAFLMYDQFHPGRYPKWLVISAAVATCLGLGVSSSRTALAMVGTVVLASVIAVTLAKPKAVGNLVKFAFLVGIALFVTSQLPVFNEGLDVFSHRVEGANKAESFVDRAFGDYTRAFDDARRAEIGGAGLGLGSNGGAALMGRSGFLLAETEWSKVILEMGPVVGFIFLGMRLGLALWLLGRCLSSAKTRTMMPMLLYGACALGLISGQWGQPTVLGFAVLGSGLCMASMRREPEAAVA